MFRVLGNLSLIALIVAAAIGLGGGGPWWLVYVGTGTLFILLLLILSQLSDIPNQDELKRMLASHQKLDLPFEYSNEEDRIVPSDEKRLQSDRVPN